MSQSQQLTPDQQTKITEALKEAGVVVPTGPDIEATIKAAFSKHGVTIKPDWACLFGSGYVLVIHDDD